MPYATYVFGGSVGEQKEDVPTKYFSGLGAGRLYDISDNKEEAQRKGKAYVKSFSGGYKNYYHPRYRVVKITDKEAAELIMEI